MEGEQNFCYSIFQNRKGGFKMHQFQRTEILTHQLSKEEFIAAVTKEGISGIIVGAQPIREELDGYHREHLVKFVPSDSSKETRVIRLSAFLHTDEIIEKLDECDIPRIEEPPKRVSAHTEHVESKPVKRFVPRATPARVQPANRDATEKRLIETLAGIHNV
jgi:hypothetical protein